MQREGVLRENGKGSDLLDGHLIVVNRFSYSREYKVSRHRSSIAVYEQSSTVAGAQLT